MAADNGQRVEGVFFVGDAVSNSTDGHVGALIKDASGNYALLELTAAGGIPVDLVDATGITVDVDVTQYAVDDVAGATDTGMLQLVVRDDALTTLTPIDGDYVQMRVNSKGALWVEHDGDVTVTATDLDIRDLTSVSDSVEVLQSTAANLNATVVATDLDIRDLSDATDSVSIGDGTDTLAVNADGSINVSSTISATDEEYATSAVAKSANADVLTYSPSASTEKMKKLMVSALGYAKWTVQYGTTASEVTKRIFWTTPASPSFELELAGLEVQTTETIIVNGENNNRQTGNMDMYVTLQHD